MLNLKVIVICIKWKYINQTLMELSLRAGHFYGKLRILCLSLEEQHKKYWWKESSHQRNLFWNESEEQAMHFHNMELCRDGKWLAQTCCKSGYICSQFQFRYSILCNNPFTVLIWGYLFHSRNCFCIDSYILLSLLSLHSNLNLI